MSKYIKLEDAIRKYAEMIADEAYWEHGVGNGKPDEEGLDIAREYYSDLPTIEDSKDCISREYLEEQLQQIEDITAMAHIDLGEDPYDETEEITMPISTVRKIFKNAPSVVVRKNRTTTEQSSMVGEWKWESEDICDNCGYEIPHIEKVMGDVVLMDSKDWHYCPNCGAKMRLE